METKLQDQAGRKTRLRNRAASDTRQAAQRNAKIDAVGIDGGEAFTIRCTVLEEYATQR